MENVESVLVIDDDPAFNRVLCRALKNRGFAAAGAHSVEEAAALIPDMQAARAVLDLNIDGTKVSNASTNAICEFPILENFSGWKTELDDASLQRIEEVIEANNEAALKRLDGSTGAADKDEL